MEYKILIKAGMKKHRGIYSGIFLLVLLVTLSLGTVLTVWSNSSVYIRSELNRAGFGTLTAWVSKISDTGPLTAEIEAVPEVERVETQPLVFADYKIGEQESDSEGQLIPYQLEDTRYRFFTDDLSGYQKETPAIVQGDVYVSPSLISMFDIEIGDNVEFAIARNSQTISFTVKGYYEDPFMGSSMIGMKGFLIAENDYHTIIQAIQSAGIDALAQDGAMLHIFKARDSLITTAGLNSKINETTSMPQYTEFVHSADAIAGFMLILQKAFSGLLIAFVLVLLLVVFVVLGHSITGTIESDYVNMGILKTAGVTTKMLRHIQLLQYAAFLLSGMVLGLALAKPVSVLVSSATLTTCGVRVPAAIPWGLWITFFLVILILLAAFIIFKTSKIGRITPMKAIRGETESAAYMKRSAFPINGTHLGISLAVRQLLTGKRNYRSACVVAALLAFFISIVGSIDTWLGEDGRGMMDAFHPADHDIGVQVFGNSTEEEVQEVISNYSLITDTYLLAMPGVAVNGIDYTANVISEPSRFRILSGNTCHAEDEIVITEFVAADLGISVGDTLTVMGDSGSAQYTVSGIYSCANDMGNNIGMSREGYLKIGKNDPQIWCHHYFLEQEAQKTAIAQALDLQFGGDVHVHENTWPGLFGIILAMRALVAFMYVMVFLMILIVTVMTGSKVLKAEQRDLTIYQAIGMKSCRLRRSFSLRFGLTALVGAVTGVLLALPLSGTLVSEVMQFAGISNFAAHPSVQSVVLPIVVVMLLFMGFAYIIAGKIKKTSFAVLIAE